MAAVVASSDLESASKTSEAGWFDWIAASTLAADSANAAAPKFADAPFREWAKRCAVAESFDAIAARIELTLLACESAKSESSDSARLRLPPARLRPSAVAIPAIKRESGGARGWEMSEPLELAAIARLAPGRIQRSSVSKSWSGSMGLGTWSFIPAFRHFSRSPA